MINVKDIAHDVARDNPSLGDKLALEKVLTSALQVILERVASGEEVHLHKFGSFKRSLFKGRTLNSPLMKGGAVTFGDQHVLRFHQAPVAKRKINEMIAAAGGGTKKAKPSKKAKAAKEPKAGKKEAPKAPGKRRSKKKTKAAA